MALIVSAIVWAYGANSSNPHLSGRGRRRPLDMTKPRGETCSHLGSYVGLTGFEPATP